MLHYSAAILMTGMSVIAIGALALKDTQAGKSLGAAQLTPFERMLIDLPPNSWHEVPETRMADVCAHASFRVTAVMGCKGIVEAWSSGAYGKGARMFYVWGGGHNDYWGNEIYGFDLRHGRWRRLTDPTPGEVVMTSGADPLPDGNPNSRHTYDGLEYLTRSHRLFAQGGSISPNGRRTSVTWLFEITTMTWHNRGSEKRPGGYNIASAYDEAGGAVLVRTPKALWVYMEDSDEWSQLVSFATRPLWPRYEVSRAKTGEIDSLRRLFWSVGNNDFLVWDIEGKKLVTESWVTSGGGQYSNGHRVKSNAGQLFESGGGEIFDSNAPGFAYDAKADQFVAWNGGAPYILDLKSKKWHRGNRDGAPENQVKTGTFGRWRYLADYNVFILVNGAHSNVRFYKNTAGGLTH